MGVRRIILDACLGFAESAGEFDRQASWQRCVVHFYRVFGHVPRPKLREVRRSAFACVIRTLLANP